MIGKRRISECLLHGAERIPQNRARKILEKKRQPAQAQHGKTNYKQFFIKRLAFERPGKRVIQPIHGEQQHECADSISRKYRQICPRKIIKRILCIARVYISAELYLAPQRKHCTKHQSGKNKRPPSFFLLFLLRVHRLLSLLFSKSFGSFLSRLLVFCPHRQQRNQRERHQEQINIPHAECDRCRQHQSNPQKCARRKHQSELICPAPQQ